MKPSLNSPDFDVWCPLRVGGETLLLYRKGVSWHSLVALRISDGSVERLGRFSPTAFHMDFRKFIGTFALKCFADVIFLPIGIVFAYLGIDIQVQMPCFLS